MNVSANIGCNLLRISINQWYPVGCTANQIFGLQSVRWRKPRWVPKAPSKLYVVTHRKRLPEDETKEMLRLNQNWKCYTKIVMQHCKKENEIRAQTGQMSAHALEQEEDEHRQLMEYNRQENERVASLRAERWAREREQLIKEANELKMKEKEKLNQIRKAALQKLIETEELVSTFIEAEDVEKRIEDALNNPVDYNFAIDDEGRIYSGRNTQPHTVDEQSLHKLSIKDKGLSNVFIDY